MFPNVMKNSYIKFTSNISTVMYHIEEETL